MALKRTNAAEVIDQPAQAEEAVTATVETVWFRDWTAKHMPESVRTALGITSAPVAAPADAAQGM